MHPNITYLEQVRNERPNWNPSDHRNAERRAADMAIGDDVEEKAVIFCEQHGLSVQKVIPFKFGGLSYPAGFFGREDSDGDLVQGHFVAFDLLVRGKTSFLAEVKLKSVSGHGSGKHYLLDCIRLQRMTKAYRHASDLQHLFVVFDPERTEAPAYGFFAVTIEQLMANKNAYRVQNYRNGEDAHKIPISEFCPLTQFLKQHSPLTETSNADQSNPFSFPDEAAGESHHCGRTAAA